MSDVEFFFLKEVLTQNFNIVDLVKFLEQKKSKTFYLDHSGHIEGDITQNHVQNEKVKKSEKPKFYRQNKFFS
jgi:hypothetical protein